VIDGNWKLIENLETQQLELYHLGEDPGETTLQNQSHPQQLTRLHKMLVKWRKEVGARPLTRRPEQKD
jgi:arylsulfatase A-like enzyme